MQRVLGWRLLPVLTPDVVGNGRPHDRSGAPACGSLALQLALTAWWRIAGVAPDVVLGFGTGELAAAYAAGILNAEEGAQSGRGGEPHPQAGTR